MTIRVEKAGLQTTIQSRPRTGLRHMGVPSSGAADPLSMALANRLVGNSSLDAALETTLTGATLKFTHETAIAITGATADCTLNGERVQQHTVIAVQTDDVLSIGSAADGVRSYVAFAGALQADEILGSSSTYMTAGFGGHGGRALVSGDELRLVDNTRAAPPLETPPEFRPPLLKSWAIRAGSSCETSSLNKPQELYDRKFTIASRSDRMGIKLEGESYATDTGGQMPSAAVFPGTIQCPQDGSLFVLSVDAGTTGGYPRVAKVARLDLHLLGQLRPGNSLMLIERSDEEAVRELQEKHAYWKAWLPDIADVI